MVRSLEERGLKVRQEEEVSGRLREDALARMPLKSFQASEKSEMKKDRVTHSLLNGIDIKDGIPMQISAICPAIPKSI